MVFIVIKIDMKQKLPLEIWSLIFSLDNTFYEYFKKMVLHHDVEQIFIQNHRKTRYYYHGIGCHRLIDDKYWILETTSNILSSINTRHILHVHPDAKTLIMNIENHEERFDVFKRPWFIRLRWFHHIKEKQEFLESLQKNNMQNISKTSDCSYPVIKLFLGIVFEMSPKFHLSFYEKQMIVNHVICLM